jgi:hypothetical protein
LWHWDVDGAQLGKTDLYWIVNILDRDRLSISIIPIPGNPHRNCDIDRDLFTISTKSNSIFYQVYSVGIPGSFGVEFDVYFSMILSNA